MRGVARRLKAALMATIDADWRDMLLRPTWGAKYGKGRFPHEGFTLTQAQLDEWKRVNP